MALTEERMRFLALSVFIVVFSCMEGGILNKDLVYKTSQGDVKFSHKFHVKVKKLKCSACHPEPFKKRFGANKFTMQDIWDGAFCGSCHNGKIAFNAKDPANCVNCHIQRSRE